MQWRDTATGYGWISIALHWVVAALVIALWFLGSSAQSAPADQRQAAVGAHTSLALSAYLVLWLRVIWRFIQKHPGPLPKQRGFFFTLGKFVHYAMLLGIVTMLISGPIMAWSTGGPIAFFSLSIPSPLEMNTQLWTFMHSIHAGTGTLIVLATLVHIGGVFKHIAFNRDGTFDKMMMPQRDSVVDNTTGSTTNNTTE